MKRQSSPAGQLTYAYLACVEHSGSTVLACLLGAHPEVSTVGEFAFNFPPAGKCSCGRLYQDCPLWAEWGARARQSGLDFQIGNLGINLQPRHGSGFVESLFYYQFPWKPLDRARDLLFPPTSARRQHAEAALDKSIRLARLLCEMEGTHVFLDTTKNPLQIRFLRRRRDIRLKMIAVTRDGRGVMHSLIEKERYSPDRAIGAWIWGNRHLERAAAHYVAPEDVFRLHLEDLWRDPEGVRGALFRFLGVGLDAPLDFTDTANRHIVGNRMRHVFTGEIRRDESWRDALHPAHRALFEQRAGWLNRRLGYTE